MVSSKALIAALVCLAAGCKDKQPAKQAPPVPPPKQDVTSAWLDKLPEVAGSVPLSLDNPIGFVGIAADGSLTVGATSPDKPASLDGLAKALGIPAAQPRQDAEFTAVEGEKPGLENPNDIKFAKLGHPALASGSPAPPKRLTTAFALAHNDPVSGGVIIVADAKAPATALVDVLAKVGGFVAVRNGKALGALPLAIDRHAPAATMPIEGWTELRLGAPAELQTLPDPPTQPALDKLEPGTDALDLLVAPETKVADLAGVIGTLRAAKVDAIGLGRAPAANSPDAQARAINGPHVIAWNVTLATGDRQDTAPLRAALDATLEPMLRCYATTLTNKATKAPQLTATAKVSFALSADQKLSAIKATEVDAKLTKCVVDALKAAKFPSPGGGGAQADLRITFAPD